MYLIDEETYNNMLIIPITYDEKSWEIKQANKRKELEKYKIEMLKEPLPF